MLRRVILNDRIGSRSILSILWFIRGSVREDSPSVGRVGLSGPGRVHRREPRPH